MSLALRIVHSETYPNLAIFHRATLTALCACTKQQWVRFHPGSPCGALVLELSNSVAPHPSIDLSFPQRPPCGSGALVMSLWRAWHGVPVIPAFLLR